MATTKIRSSSITDGQVANADLSATVAVTGGQIADDAVTLAKMADGTQGDTLYYGAAGAPTLLAKPGTPADEVLTFATGATAPSWVAAAGGNNVPRFSVYASAGWDLSDNTWTINPFDSADVNDDGASGTCVNITASGTNPRGFTVPAGEAGKYVLSYTINHYTISGNMEAQYVAIYKGVSGGAAAEYIGKNYMYVGATSTATLVSSVIVDAAVGDHYYIYSLNQCGDTNGRVYGGRLLSNFSGFKLL
jgi:hypothetical protein